MNEEQSETGSEKEWQHDLEQPKIYVASLSDYNVGTLHGRWINAALEPDELAEEIKTMLSESTEPHAEEFAIFDYESFGPLHLSEHESIETVSTVARGIREHGPPFAHWAALVGTDDLDELARFEEVYRGHFDSVESYAEELMNEIGCEALIEKMPPFFRNYIFLDVVAVARDLKLSGDIRTSEGDGNVYVFEGP